MNVYAALGNYRYVLTTCKSSSLDQTNQPQKEQATLHVIGPVMLPNLTYDPL